MIEIKELDMHLEDNTLVHNTKGHEKREGHRWKEERAAYVEELFEYVWKVADHFMPAYVEPWEEGEEPSDAPVTFARRYLSGSIEQRERMLERFSDEQIQNTIRAYGLDADKLWYLMCFVADYISGFEQTIQTGRWLFDEWYDFTLALEETAEIVLKKGNGRTCCKTSRKEIVDIVRTAMELYTTRYKVACDMRDKAMKTYDKCKQCQNDEEAKSLYAKAVSMAKKANEIFVELELDGPIPNKSPLLKLDEECESISMEMSHRQYRFAKIMLWFLGDKKGRQPQDVEEKVYKERHFFVSMMLYVCGIYNENEDEARSKWYEPYFQEKDNRNLSNLVRNYKNRKLPIVINKWFGY